MKTQTHKWLPSEPTNEQDAFENVFPLPEHCTRFEGGYAPTRYNAWSAQSFCDRWEGWKARAALTSSGQAAPEVEQEPSVFLVWHDGEFTYTKYPEEYQNIYEALPLYTHPQPKQPEQSLDMVKREPLSNNAIQQLIVNNGGSMLEFARAIEKAHGIGVSDE